MRMLTSLMKKDVEKKCDSTNTVSKVSIWLEKEVKSAVIDSCDHSTGPSNGGDNNQDDVNDTKV